jgi:hypothetical protein
MVEAYQAGDPVPDGLFSVDGDAEAGLRFDVSVRVYESDGVRHVYPVEPIHGIEEVVSPAESSPHETIFEGVNTILYFDPVESE